jgi:2-hydroxy-6-oxonona-2,4-dienedioate hydrolase
MVTRSEVTVDGRPAFVWRGGEGDSLVLVHGAWAGAEVHWAPVWERFAAQYRVVAPDFPGLAYDAAWVPGSFDDSVRWIEGVLDASDTRKAWIVGSSFGAALAARLASRSPQRCLGLVLVDGGPAPKMPVAVRAVVTRWPLRQAMEGMFRRGAYGSAILRRGFADRGRAPTELHELATHPRPRQLRVVNEIVLAGDPPVAAPPVRTLVVWGGEDRLLGSNLKAGRRLARSLPDAELAVIPGAGHLPQVEKPDQFARTVFDFVRRTG